MSWNWRNINAQKSPEIASTVASGAAAGTMIAPGVGTVIGGIVGLGIGLGKAGEGGKTKMHHSYTRANDNIGRGKIRDPFGGGAYWDYEGVPEHIAPDTAIWDLASMAMNLAPSVVSAVGGASGGQTKIDSGPIPVPQVNTPKNSSTSFMGNTMSPLMDKYQGLGIVKSGYTESIPDRPAIEMVPGRTTITQGHWKATPEQGYSFGPGTMKAIPGPGRPDIHMTENSTVINKGIFKATATENISITPGSIKAVPVNTEPVRIDAPEYNVAEYQVPETMFETMFPELSQQQTINMPKYQMKQPSLQRPMMKPNVSVRDEDYVHQADSLFTPETSVIAEKNNKRNIFNQQVSTEFDDISYPEIKDPLWSQWEQGMESYPGDYQYGAKGSGNKYNDTDKESIDCSGIMCEINKEMGWDKINVGAANIRDKFDKVLTKDTVGHGDLIYVRAKKASENHIAQILIDPVTKKKYIAESAASKRKDGKTGVRIEPYDERIKELEKVGKVEYGRINKIYNKYNS